RRGGSDGHGGAGGVAHGPTAPHGADVAGAVACPSGPGDRTPVRPAPQYGASSRRDTGAGGGRRPHCRWPVGPSEAVARHTALHAVRPSGRAIAYKVLRAEDGTTRPPPPWEQGIGDARTARQA